jgi:hypothetical protein
MFVYFGQQTYSPCFVQEMKPNTKSSAVFVLCERSPVRLNLGL